LRWRARATPSARSAEWRRGSAAAASEFAGAGQRFTISSPSGVAPAAWKISTARQRRDRDVRDRADGQRVGHGPDAHGAAEQPAGGEDRQLYRGADGADGQVGAGADAQRQAVARAGSQPRADVGAGRHAVEHDAAGEARDPGPRRVRRRDEREHDVHHAADDHDVRRRAEPRPLPQRPPQGQHGRADDDHPGTDAEAERARQALVQHVPGIEPEAGQHEHGGAGAVEHQAGVELGEPARGHAAARS
jgi:hypothetical protein